MITFMQMLIKHVSVHDAFTAIVVDCSIFCITAVTTSNGLVNKHMQTCRHLSTLTVHGLSHIWQ